MFLSMSMPRENVLLIVFVFHLKIYFVGGATDAGLSSAIRIKQPFSGNVMKGLLRAFKNLLTSNYPAVVLPLATRGLARRLLYGVSLVFLLK